MTLSRTDALDAVEAEAALLRERNVRLAAEHDRDRARMAHEDAEGALGLARLDRDRLCWALQKYGRHERVPMRPPKPHYGWESSREVGKVYGYAGRCATRRKAIAGGRNLVTEGGFVTAKLIYVDLADGALNVLCRNLADAINEAAEDEAVLIKLPQASLDRIEAALLQPLREALAREAEEIGPWRAEDVREHGGKT